MLNEFLNSTQGRITGVIVVLLLFSIILFVGRKQKIDARALVISAIFAALYFVLNQIIFFRMPQGGSVTAFSMLAITACGYVLGLRPAVLAGMSAGIMTLIFDPYVVHPVQLLLDYPIAVGSLGLAALLRNHKYGLQAGFLLGAFSRFICSFLSGIVFFAEYTPEGFNTVVWSLIYNISYIGPEMLITLVFLFLPPVKRLFSSLKEQAG